MSTLDGKRDSHTNIQERADSKQFHCGDRDSNAAINRAGCPRFENVSKCKYNDSHRDTHIDESKFVGINAEELQWIIEHQNIN